MFHARKYVGTEHVGYGYHWIEKDREDALERAVFSYYIRTEMLPYLSGKGCPSQNVDRFGRLLDNYIARYTGRLSLAIGKEDGANITNATIQALCKAVDVNTLLKVLLLGARVNSEKIVKVFHLIKGDLST